MTNMKFITLTLIITILLTSCDQYPKEHLGIVTYNMQYAPAGPNYKIFALRSNVSATSIDHINYDYTSPNFNSIKKHIANLLRQHSSQDLDDDEIVGRDVEIRFTHPNQQKQFDADVSVSTACFYYYFEGHFIGKHIFQAQKYRLFERKKDCATQSQTSWEQILDDSNNDNRLSLASE